MLAIVEHEQRLLIAQQGGQPVGRRVAAGAAAGQNGRDCFRHARGIADSGEIDEAHAVGEVRRQRLRQMKRQRRLAHAARTDDGDDAAGAQQAFQLLEGRFTTDQPRGELRDPRKRRCGRQ
jgi:hypothetical protein